MCPTGISVWFVCRLCRGSFGQVDAFIEHKKQKHFNEFQNTSFIVFEEMEHGLLRPVISSNGDHEFADESNESSIKIEVNDNDTVIPFSSEIIEQPNLGLFEPKSELITYESEINEDIENNFLGMNQPEQNPNPFVLLERLTSEEIQSACVPQHHSTLLRFEQKNVTNNSEPPNSLHSDSNTIDHIEVEKSTEIQPTTTAMVIQLFKERNLHECKLCSKQLQSNGHLQIHVGICALYHTDRNRFCVSCNRIFYDTFKLKDHRLRFHGTEEEKLSLFKYKCQLCPKKYRESTHLRFHMESHDLKNQNKPSKLKCSYPNCRIECRFRSVLQRHISIVHLGVKPFGCSFPNCNKTFTQRVYLERHFLTHTGESHKETKQNEELTNSNLYKCSHKNCGKEFRLIANLQRHISDVHLGVKPFSCSFPNCNKTFQRKDHVKRHFLTHTRERPYKCTVDNCNRAFTTSEKCLIHHRIVHRI